MQLDSGSTKNIRILDPGNTSGFLIHEKHPDFGSSKYIRILDLQDTSGLQIQGIHPDYRSRKYIRILDYRVMENGATWVVLKGDDDCRVAMKSTKMLAVLDFLKNYKCKAGQIDKWIDRQIDREIERQIERYIEIYIYRHVGSGQQK